MPFAVASGVLGWSVNHHLVAVESIILCILIGIPATLCTRTSAVATAVAAVGRIILCPKPIASILDRRVSSSIETALLVSLFPATIKGFLGARHGRVCGHPNRFPAHGNNPTIRLLFSVSLDLICMVVGSMIPFGCGNWQSFVRQTISPQK